MTIPLEFERRDSGDFVVRRSSLARLREHGAGSAVEVMQLRLDKTIQDNGVRQRGVLAPPEFSGTNSRQLFLKRHFHDAALESPDLGDGRKEFEAILRCEAAGIPVVKVIAYGALRNHESIPTGSFLITEEAGGGIAADKLTHCWRADPELRGATQELRHSLIRSVAATASLLYNSGLYHQDLYWSHFFPEYKEEQLDVVATLIDLQRIVAPKSTTSKLLYLLKDLAQLRISMERVGLSNAEIQLFYDEYFQSATPLFNRFINSQIPFLAWLRCWKRLMNLKAEHDPESVRRRIKIEGGREPFPTGIPHSSSRLVLLDAAG